MAKRGIQLTLGIGMGTVALLAMLMLLALSIGPAHPALAAGCNVPSGSYPTIQAAVNDANCSPIVVAAGTYNENIVITRSLTLQGAGAASTIINGGRAGVVISIGKGAAPVIEGFTITGGDGSSNNGEGGGVSIREATAIIRNNVISDNVASQVVATAGLGGGIFVISSTNPVRIYNNVIQANLAYSVSLASPTGAQYGVGAGIMIGDASSAVITGNQILSNVSARTDLPSSDASGLGGGIGAWGNWLIIEGNTIQDNLGIASGLRGFGGGILSVETLVVTITNNTIVENTGVISGSDASGGGIYLGVFSGSGQKLTLTGNWVMSNTAGVTVTPNAAFGMPSPYVGGGGLRIWGGEADNDTLTLENNHLLYNVGAVYVNDLNGGSAEGGGLSAGRISTTLIISNEISYNTAARSASTSGTGDWGGGVSGGGISFWQSDDITIQDSRFENNVAAEELSANGVGSSSDGGGLNLANFQTATLRDNWIVGNVTVLSGSITSATGENYGATGGGLRLDGFDVLNDSVTVENNHIIDNMAAQTMSTSGTAQGHAEGGGLCIGSITTTLITGNEVRGNVAVKNLSLSGDGSGKWGGRPSGGGMFIGEDDAVTLMNNEIRDNVTAEQQVVNNVDSTSEGGGIALGNVTQATVSNNTISGNAAVMMGSLTSNVGSNYFPSGGGVMIGCWDKPSCTLSFTGNDISNNTAAYTVTVSGSDANGGASGGGFNVSQVSDVSFNGNTISGNRALVFGSASGSNEINGGGGGASFDSSTALLQSNVVRDNIGYLAGSDGYGGGINFGESTATMEGNLILSNRSTQSRQGSPATWVWRGALTSTNDIFAHNMGGVGSGTDGPPARMTIINDTFYDNGDRGIEVNDAASTVYVTNTIVFSHEHGLRLNDPASTLSGDYNLLSNTLNYAGGATGGSNDILNQDPLFVNAAADDFHLNSNSPAIDQGDDAVAPAVDFEGDPRPFDGDSDGTARVDIGADEYLIRDLYLPMILKNASP